MSARALKQLAAVVVAILVLWGVVALVKRGGSPAEPAELSTLLEALADTASLREVRFVPPRGEAVALERSQGGWTVDGNPADSGAVARFLQEIAGAAPGRLAGRSAATHARLGLARDSAYVLELRGGRGGLTLLVGDAGPRWGTTHVRRVDAETSWLVSAELRTAVQRGRDEWRSRRVAALDTAAIRRIEVQREDDTYALSRGDSAWTLADGAPADPATVRGILDELHDLQADGILSPQDSLAALEQAGSVVVRSAGDTPLATLSFGAGQHERWLRAGEGGTVYRISSYRFDRLAPKREQAARR